MVQVLSRVTCQGALERLSEQIYHRSPDNAFGKSRPNPAAIQKLVAQSNTIFPSGIAAVNHDAEGSAAGNLSLPPSWLATTR